MMMRAGLPSFPVAHFVPFFYFIDSATSSLRLPVTAFDKAQLYPYGCQISLVHRIENHARAHTVPDRVDLKTGFIFQPLS
jgi:hypothetical protein